jgi:hypothetical protein
VPLLALPVVKYLRNASRHWFRVRPETGDLGDRAGEVGEDLFGDPGSRGVTGLVIDRPQLRGASPGDVALDVAVVSNEGCPQAGVLKVGEPVDAGVQDIADSGDRIIPTSAVAVDVLLDAAPDLVDGGRAELHDVERVQDCDVVVEPVGDGVLVVVERVQRGDLHAAAERVVAGLQQGRVGLARSARDQITAWRGGVHAHHGSDRPCR